MHLLSLVFVAGIVSSIHAEQSVAESVSSSTQTTNQTQIVPMMIHAEDIARYVILFALERKDLVNYNKEAWSKLLEKSLDFGRHMQQIKHSGGDFPYQVFIDYITALADVVKSDETKSIATLLNFGMLPVPQQVDTKVAPSTIEHKTEQLKTVSDQENK